MKTCTGECGKVKPLTEFYKCSKSKDGLRGDCRTCTIASQKPYLEANRESARIRATIWRIDNPGKAREAQKLHYQKNRERIREEQKQYYVENSTAIREKVKQWSVDNAEYISKYNVAYNINNREEIAARRKKYYAENREKIAAKCKHYRENNVEKLALKSKAWRKANPEKCAAASSRNRAAKRQATPPWSEVEQIEALFCKRNKQRKRHNKVFHIDHVIPIVNKRVSGLHCLDNLRLTRWRNNLCKSNKFDQERESNRQLTTTKAKLKKC